MLKIVHDSKPKFQDPCEKLALISQKASCSHCFLIYKSFLFFQLGTDS